MSAADLWSAVKDRYDSQTIISITNVRNRAAGVTSDVVGEQAAQDVIDSFPIYIQTIYDASSPTHKQVAINGVITFLWLRGGSSANAQAMKLEEWEKFGDKLKMSEPRAHGMPTRTKTDDQGDPSSGISCGPPCTSWADRRNFRGLLPRCGGYGPYGGPDEWQ